MEKIKKVAWGIKAKILGLENLVNTLWTDLSYRAKSTERALVDPDKLGRFDNWMIEKHPQEYELIRRYRGSKTDLNDIPANERLIIIKRMAEYLLRG